MTETIGSYFDCRRCFDIVDAMSCCEDGTFVDKCPATKMRGSGDTNEVGNSPSVASVPPTISPDGVA